MDKPYSLLMQKMKDGADVKDSLDSFGVVCTGFPFQPIEEVKDLPSRDWPEEDGEDVYVPERLCLKAYDMDVDMVYVGKPGSAASGMRRLTDYLTGADGDGILLKIYNPHTRIGRQGVYLKGIQNLEFSQTNLEDIVEFTLALRVTDPRTDVALTTEEE